MTDVPPTPMPSADTPPADKPPKRAPRKTPPESVAPGASGAARERPKRTPKLQTQLEELFAMPALAYSFAGDKWAAELFTTRAPAMAEAWAELADKNPAIKRVLSRLVESSAWGGVFVSTAAIAVPLLQHHGIAPGADPFTAFYPELPSQEVRGPIVPPPPAAFRESRPSAPPSAPDGGGGAGQSPPGVVTVASSNDSHTMVGID